MMDEDATAFKKKFSFKKKEIVEVEIISIDDSGNYSEDSEEGSVGQISEFSNSNCSTSVTIFRNSDKEANPSLEYSPTKEKENDIKISHQNVTSQNETKDAWKGLFGLMQRNQKEALKNIKNKPQKRGLTAAFDSAKNKQKKLKTDFVDNSSNSRCSSIEKVMEASTSTSPQKQNKIADIFLKPKEKLAAAADSAKLQRLENLNLCGGESFLKAVSVPTTVDSEKVIEDPKYFDGNIIKLNPGSLSDDTGPKKTKVCPFYKKLPGTNFSVDAFNFGVIPGINVYLLSHFHSDHYIGLTKKFSKTLVCSIPTGNLVQLKIGVNEDCIRKLQLNKPYVIEGSEIVLVDANHCPGSVMFIIRLPNGTTYFHTGDFRYTSDMLENTFIAGSIGTDCLYLDTTYCDPKYDFPKQVDSIGQLVVTVKKHVESNPRTLIICGSYLIGKERVYFTLAEALNTKVFGTYEKRRIINALENPLFSHYITDKENLADVHVMNMQCINPKLLSEYLSARSSVYTNVIGIKPSGWQFSSAGSSSGVSIKNYYGKTVTIIGVPYSEHSSFSELKELVTAIKPIKVQPTVNVGSVKKRTEMMEHFGKWLKK